MNYPLSRVKQLVIILSLLVVCGCTVSKAEIDACETMCKTNGGIRIIEAKLGFYEVCHCVNGMEVELYPKVGITTNNIKE
jgi:hypothetical protein